MDTATLWNWHWLGLQERFGARCRPPAWRAPRASAAMPSNAFEIELGDEARLPQERCTPLTLAGRKQGVLPARISFEILGRHGAPVRCIGRSPSEHTHLRHPAKMHCRVMALCREFNGVVRSGRIRPGGAGAWPVASPTSAADGASWRKSSASRCSSAISKDASIRRRVMEHSARRRWALNREAGGDREPHRTLRRTRFAQEIRTVKSGLRSIPVGHEKPDGSPARRPRDAWQSDESRAENLFVKQQDSGRNLVDGLRFWPFRCGIDGYRHPAQALRKGNKKFSAVNWC